MGALACPVGETDQLLLAFGRRANDDKNALLLVLEPRLQVDAVRPHIDIAPGREIALLPAFGFPGPPSFNRATVDADRPGASLPSSAASASSKSPVEMPFR